MNTQLRDTTFLVTGGTGSFGNTIVRKLLSEGVQEVRILSRDEKKQDDLRRELSDERVRFYIGDVRDKVSVDNTMKGVDYVFHAAALKQVPSCDFFPLEATKTNILGASNVLSSCRQFDVQKAIVLSTDKAVYPINAMGMSKAMMEKVMVAESRTCGASQIFAGTRYGNVIASRGSVIPLFIQQLANGQPLTITDPSMTRFLMSLEDASNLVLFAFEHANPGDIFVQKSPAATIETLAKAVARLLGKEATAQIKEIGIRHGEKRYETLVSQEDMCIANDLGDFYRIPADNRDLNYNLYFSSGQEPRKICAYSSDSTYLLSVEELVELLRSNTQVQALLDRA